jgi:hypothetical protein
MRGQHPHEALELLDSVYGRFTEGFDTPDLLKAKRLIDELKMSSNRPDLKYSV